MRNKARTTTGVLATTTALALVTTACSTGNATESAQTAAPAPAPVVQQAGTKASQQDIAALFPVWNAALATGDPNKVADLYAPDAVLLPTVSDDVRTSRAEIVDYFQHFLENKPSGTIEKELVNVLDADTAINTGVYRFAITGKDGKPTEVEARYTYVYELRDGKWLIVNHHSSSMPEKK
jgi:uncharacterized protein (TIGR02246 family)